MNSGACNSPWNDYVSVTSSRAHALYASEQFSTVTIANRRKCVINSNNLLPSESTILSEYLSLAALMFPPEYIIIWIFPLAKISRHWWKIYFFPSMNYYLIYIIIFGRWYHLRTHENRNDENILYVFVENNDNDNIRYCYPKYVIALSSCKKWRRYFNTLLRHIGKVLYGIVEMPSAQKRKINANCRDFLVKSYKKHIHTCQTFPQSSALCFLAARISLRRMFVFPRTRI